MVIESTHLFPLSIKGTTEKLVNETAKSFPNVRKHTNVTRKIEPRIFSTNELVVVGAPVYGGRVPVPMIKRLNSLKGKNTPAIAIVVYGNRAYDDALLELKDTLTAQGFQVVAGIVYVAQHSLAPKVATGRPDAKDLEIARQYGNQVIAKLDAVLGSEELKALTVPGNFPYIKPSVSHDKQREEDFNPMMRALMKFLLPKMFTGDKQPELYV